MRWVLGSGLRFWRWSWRWPSGSWCSASRNRAARLSARSCHPASLPRRSQIQTEALGLSAAEVESSDHRPAGAGPAERRTVAGPHPLDSSMPGLSAIDLTFQPGTDLYAARQMVQERMTQAHALPNVGSPPIMIQPLASASRVAMIGLSIDDRLSPVEMSVLARWKIRPRLMGVPGVANVSGLRPARPPAPGPGGPAPAGAAARHAHPGDQDRGQRAVGVAADASSRRPRRDRRVRRVSRTSAWPSSTSPHPDPAQLSAGPARRPPAASAPARGHHHRGRGPPATDRRRRRPHTGGLLLAIDKFPGTNTLEVTRGIQAAMHDMAPA